MEKTKTCIVLTADVREKVDKFMADTGTSMSELVRVALRKFFKDIENENKVVPK